MKIKIDEVFFRSEKRDHYRYLQFLIDLILDLPASPKTIQLTSYRDNRLKYYCYRQINQLYEIMHFYRSSQMTTIDMASYAWYLIVNKIYARINNELWRVLEMNGNKFEIIMESFVEVPSIENLVESLHTTKQSLHMQLIELIEQMLDYDPDFCTYLE